MQEKMTPVVVVVPGDLHLTRPGLENHRVAQWVVDEVNTLVRPDFVQWIGDNVQDAEPEQFDLFTALTDRLAVPWYALPGDHDVKDDPTAVRFRTRVGQTCGSLSLRGFRFVRLNTQEARPVGLLPTQTAWFAGEVDDALAKGERVVVFQHNYPYQIWEDFAGPGIDDWRAVVQTRRIAAIVTGHTHYGQIANDGRNVLVTTRSIGDPEGGPPGYTLLYLQGEDLAVTYRSVEDRGPLLLVTHPRETLLCTGPAHVVRGDDRVTVRVWSADAVVQVQARVDEGPWVNLESHRDGDFRGPLRARTLSKGTHRLDVRAVSRSEADAEQTMTFFVDPTGRYTAVPGVRPEVTATAFC